MTHPSAPRGVFTLEVGEPTQRPGDGIKLARKPQSWRPPPCRLTRRRFLSSSSPGLCVKREDHILSDGSGLKGGPVATVGGRWDAESNPLQGRLHCLPMDWETLTVARMRRQGTLSFASLEAMYVMGRQSEKSFGLWSNHPPLVLETEGSKVYTAQFIRPGDAECP